MDKRPREFWTNWMSMETSLERAKELWPKAEWEDLRCYVEKSSYDKAIEALKFECGNRCAEQNPCNASDVLKELREL
jgi:hypothetical protein